MAGWAEENTGARSQAAGAVRRSVINAKISLRLNDPAGVASVSEDFAEQSTRHVHSSAHVEGAGERLHYSSSLPLYTISLRWNLYFIGGSVPILVENSTSLSSSVNAAVLGNTKYESARSPLRVN